MLAPSRPSEGAPWGGRRSDLVDWTYRTATDSWSPLPKWAGFFRELGSAVAGVDQDVTRVVTAITTPTRAFAAALCAAGVVIERAKNHVAADPAAHFAYLRTLALGTAVTYRPGSTGSKKGRGILHAFSAKDGEDYVLIRDPRGGVHWMPARMADRVEPIMTEPRRPLGHAMRFTRVNLKTGLMSGLLDPDRATAFVGNSRLECVVVGNRSLLREELTAAPFAVSTGRKHRIEGFLQDVARARAFLPQGECYRSDVVSVASRALPARLASSPAVAIFDGSRSLLRWSRSYPAANWIIILDRADRRLADAVEMIDALYATRVGDPAALTIKSTPIGVECAAFNVRRGAV